MRRRPTASERAVDASFVQAVLRHVGDDPEGRCVIDGPSSDGTYVGQMVVRVPGARSYIGQSVSIEVMTAATLLYHVPIVGSGMVFEDDRGQVVLEVTIAPERDF